ncbi:MAG: transglutaminase-like cysteine peptidase [Alphaproteobacteria bacterium]|nr:transglutaminase-like cysteine peptidase [Alphaproteobacteria bacterium]
MHKVFYAELVRPGKDISKPQDFPRDTQALLEEISDGGLSDEEKISLINAHVNDKVHYKEQNDYDPSPSQTAADTLKIGQGDCDDASYPKAVLLKQAGIDESRIFFLAVNSRYEFEDNKRTGTSPHTLTIVENKGEFLVLDGLTDDVRPLGKDLQTEGGIHIRNQDELGPGRQVITDVMGVGTLSGEYFKPKNDIYSGIEPNVNIAPSTAPSYSAPGQRP